MRVHEYKGFKIVNTPYKSEPRWFVYTEDMERVKKIYPKGTLRECRECIDVLVEKGTDT